jgi:colanic acid biosynthesis protein WcaH
MIIDEPLYRQILRVMPIPSVDLIVEDENQRVLLAKRANEPARGMWWFPGGRVHFLETRLLAAERKLKEECGLLPEKIIELGTFDVIVEKSDDPDAKFHGITTLFHVKVSGRTNYTLDAQNSEADWRLPDEWLKFDLPRFVQESLLRFSKSTG